MMSRLPVKANFLFFFFIAQLFHSTLSLYPDQVGKWDWHLSFTGHASKIVPLHLEYSANPTFIIASHLQVLSSIHLRNGSISWRQVLESRSDTKSWNLIQLDSNGLLLKDTSNGEDNLPPSLLTVTAGGRYIRSWDVKIGSLNWEKSLPDHLIKSSAIFSLDLQKSKLIHIEKDDSQPNKLAFTRVDLTTLTSENIDTVQLTNLSLDLNSCTTALPYVLICANGNELITISPTHGIKKLNLDSFSAQAITSNDILYTNNQATKSIISIKLVGKRSVSIISVSSDGSLELVDTLDEVDAVTVSPVNDQVVLFSISGNNLNAFDVNFIFSSSSGPSSTKPLSVLSNLQTRLALPSSQKVKLLHVLVFPSSAYKVLLVTEDESIHLYSKSNGLAWSREEALSDIVATGFVDLPSKDELIEHSFVSTNLPQQFIARIGSQVQQLQDWTLEWIKIISNLIEGKGFASSTLSSSQLGLRSRRVTQLDSNEPLKVDYFGLRKLIFLVTAAGKIFTLDTVTGSIVWSHYMSQLKDVSSLTIHVHRSHVTIVTVNGLLISLDGVTGAIIEKKTLDSRVLQSMQLPQFDRPIVILLSTGNFVIYPASATMNHELVYMVTLNTTTGTLTGLQLPSSSTKSQVVWTLNIPGANQLIPKRPFESVHSQGRVLGDRNVLYKYLNPNLLVVTVEKTSLLQIDIHLVDAVSGRIIYSASHRKCRGPVFVVHSENSVIYTYYSERGRRHEMSVIDLYEGLSQVNGTTFSSLERGLDKQLIHHASFIFPTGILAMVDTVTEKGITNKHILLALPSGGILELPKAFIDARRPLHPTPEHREEGLIPYLPELPIASESFINYNKSILAAKGISVVPSGLESTCLVFAYGLDAFFTRVMPSKTFDILKDDFDHILIATVLTALIVLAYASKWLSARKTLRTAWA